MRVKYADTELERLGNFFYAGLKFVGNFLLCSANFI
jgi:hypothetical protein